MKILNFGSLNIDFVYYVERFLRPGETAASKNMEVFAGGKGLNQSVALSRAKVLVFHAGALGFDGAMLKNFLNENGVDTSLLKESGKRSGHAIIQVDPSGQNCILLYGGANMDMDIDYINSVLAGFGEGDIILLQNEINLLPDIMGRAHERGMRIFLNPSPMNSQVFALPLEYVDCFILNEVEAEDICGAGDEDRLLDQLHKRFPSAEIVLTLGEKGAVCMREGKVYRQAAYSVPVTDTTAAGDTFTGYYIAAVSEGAGCVEALQRASAAAALSVSRKGAAQSIPYLDEVLSTRLWERP
ncbi:MAG: Ribokinase [Firmicutes bacterium ADurb.Bin182]|nr:MAG: Ribokinase [Firmicutes bacterium ADurb.Bin182]